MMTADLRMWTPELLRDSPTFVPPSMRPANAGGTTPPERSADAACGAAPERSATNEHTHA